VHSAHAEAREAATVSELQLQVASVAALRSELAAAQDEASRLRAEIALQVVILILLISTNY
jgi:uncharacterized small protein (DUF1192 family)